MLEGTLPTQSTGAASEESVRLLRALRHLNQILPLKYRQASLTAPIIAVHRSILHSFAKRGRPLTTAEIAAMLQGQDAALNALAVLASKDLVVLNSAAEKDAATRNVIIKDPNAVEVLGAYPFSVKPTAFIVNLFGQDVFAMCALDAMSMAPMFHTETRIKSKCHLTEEPIEIHQREMEILDVKPSPHVQFGIRWQKGSPTAAHGI